MEGHQFAKPRWDTGWCFTFLLLLTVFLVGVTKLDEKKKPKVSKVTLIVVMVYARGVVSPQTDSERHPSGGLEGKASENF